jgi:hypothetical protein
MNHNLVEKFLEETDEFRDARHLVNVEGMSSPRVCNLLNRLVAGMDKGEHYLEIGTWKGRTLLSAAYGNRGRLCVGCDKFRFFGRYTGWGFRARRAFHANLRRYASESAEVRFFEMPSRTLFRRRLVPGPVGVYFYDGAHSYEDTRENVAAGAHFLSTRAVVLVDDWNVPHIRRGTLDGLAAAGLRILWSRDLEGDHSERGWWNGVGAFYVERPAAGAARA